MLCVGGGEDPCLVQMVRKSKKRGLDDIFLHGGCQQRRLIAEAMEEDDTAIPQPRSELADHLVQGGCQPISV